MKCFEPSIAHKSYLRTVGVFFVKLDVKNPGTGQIIFSGPLRHTYGRSKICRCIVVSSGPGQNRLDQTDQQAKPPVTPVLLTIMDLPLCSTSNQSLCIVISSKSVFQ